MFIAGVVIGPALAIIAGDFLFHSTLTSVRWRLLAVGLIMLVIAVVPFFAVELKAGLLIGFPLGLLLAATPMALRPDERSESPTSSS
jgi:predicted anti-sigma-YlaC factor YlaD